MTRGYIPAPGIECDIQIDFDDRCCGKDCPQYLKMASHFCGWFRITLAETFFELPLRCETCIKEGRPEPLEE